MPTLTELFTKPLSRPAFGFFCFGYTLSVLHILLCALLWLYVPFFTVFFSIHFLDATTTLLFSLFLTLGITLLLDYHSKTAPKDENP